MAIHSTAVIDAQARIDTSAEIGPYCVVEGPVTIGKNVKLKAHVCVAGHTSIGDDTVIYPFASIGHAPQDLKYKGEPTKLIIGERNTIREHVTMNPGTEGGGGITQIGDNCLFMVGTHVAHDCKIGNQVILANNATLAGHVEVGDHTIIGGLAAVHQFVRIGKHAIIGGLSGVEHDVIPYGSVIGERGSLAGLNLVGLKRRGFDRDTIHALRNAYKMLFESTDAVLEQRCAWVKSEYEGNAEVAEILDFIAGAGSRSMLVPKQHGQ